VQALDAGGEEAVVVDRVDDRLADELVHIAQGAHLQLPQQVLVQALAAGIAEVEAALLAAVAAGGAGLDVVVDVVPGAVDRQLVGDVLLAVHLPFAIDLGRRLGRLGSLTRVALPRLALVLPFASGLVGVLFLALFGRLEHDVRLQRLLDLGLQLERGELQQADRLLQLRRHRQMLAEAEL